MNLVDVMDQEKIGKFIQKLRKEKELTQQELVNKLNVTDRAVSKWGILYRKLKPGHYRIVKSIMPKLYLYEYFSVEFDIK